MNKMMSFFNLLNKKKIEQKSKSILKIALCSCIIFIILNGTALAADRDVIVGYKKPVEATEKKLITDNGGTVKKNLNVINAVSARIPENNIKNLKNNSNIKYIVNDTVFKASDEYSSSWGVQYIGSRAVHDQNINGTGVKVAILDTGIDYNHPDLNTNYKGGYDFVFNDADPMDDSTGIVVNSHGTHAAGIIAAQNNGVGPVGVAPKSDIYAVKVLDGAGFGMASFIISGLEWAMINGADIISMSIESTENNTALLEAINAANNSGILLVAAGGNDRTGTGTVKYPAAYDAVIAVTAIDQNGQKASFSPIDPKIEISAPGVNVLSTVIGGGYGTRSGTSMAAPHATGAAALIFSSNFPDVNGDGIRDHMDVREIIRNSAFDVGDPGHDNIYGYGLLDVSNATLGISAFAFADLSITVDDGVSKITSGNTYIYSITVKNNGASDASGVQVFDTWPAGFIRSAMTPSQGTCDTAVNFSCDLGTLAKNAIANIDISYIVPDTVSPGNYTNIAMVTSTSSDNNAGNNTAQDINIVEVILDLIVKHGPPDESAKNVSLLKGNYSIIINNSNLSKINMMVYENGILREDLSAKFKLNKSQFISFNMNIESPELDFVFVPYGDNGSTGRITIRRI